MGSIRGALFRVSGKQLMALKLVLGMPSGTLFGLRVGTYLKLVEQPLPKAGRLSWAGLGRFGGQGKRASSARKGGTRENSSG